VGFTVKLHLHVRNYTVRRCSGLEPEIFSTRFGKLGRPLPLSYISDGCGDARDLNTGIGRPVFLAGKLLSLTLPLSYISTVFIIRIIDLQNTSWKKVKWLKLNFVSRCHLSANCSALLNCLNYFQKRLATILTKNEPVVASSHYSPHK
jgi:hypothetical protein